MHFGILWQLHSCWAQGLSFWASTTSKTLPSFNPSLLGGSWYNCRSEWPSNSSAKGEMFCCTKATSSSSRISRHMENHGWSAALSVGLVSAENGWNWKVPLIYTFDVLCVPFILICFGIPRLLLHVWCGWVEHWHPWRVTFLEANPVPITVPSKKSSSW